MDEVIDVIRRQRLIVDDCYIRRNNATTELIEAKNKEESKKAADSYKLYDIELQHAYKILNKLKEEHENI